MRETWVRSLGQKDPLEEDMAVYSSILAWSILWTEETGRLHTVHGVTKSWTQLSNFHSLTQNVLCLIECCPMANESILVSLCVKQVYGVSGGETVPCFPRPGRAGFGFLLREWGCVGATMKCKGGRDLTWGVICGADPRGRAEPCIWLRG